MPLFIIKMVNVLGLLTNFWNLRPVIDQKFDKKFFLHNLMRSTKCAIIWLKFMKIFFNITSP